MSFVILIGIVAILLFGFTEYAIIAMLIGGMIRQWMEH